MPYETVFEIAEDGLGNLVFVLPGVAFIAIGAVMLRFRDTLLRNQTKTFRSIFPCSFSVCSSLDRDRWYRGWYSTGIGES